MRSLPLALFRVVVAIGLVLELSILAFWAGPDIEALVAPVLARQEVDAAERPSPAAFCFTWRFDKVREAAFEDAGFTLRAGGRIYPYQRLHTLADSEHLDEAVIRRPVKPGQWSRKCIDLPPALIGRPFRVTGFVEYRTPLTGRWWTVRQPLPEVFAP